MNSHRYYVIFGLIAISALLLAACGPTGIVKPGANGQCPPGYNPVPDENVGSPGSCKPDYECPPGYHPVQSDVLFGLWYCELDETQTPTPSPQPQADDPGPPFPTSTPQPQAGDVGPPISTLVWITPTPIVVHASDPDAPEPQLAIEVVPYCANPGAKLGGVNITYPSDNSLHVEDWFSDKPGHVKCVDDVSNPRTCWGPEATTFEVLLCNTDFVQNDVYVCKPLPVTLGSCAAPRDNPEPAPTACVHC